MILRIPLTGTVLVEGSLWGKGDLKGDDNDPIRPVSINLGNVSCRTIDVDLEKEEMIIDVAPAITVKEPDLDENGVQKVDEEGELKFKKRLTTENEKANLLEAARQKVEGHTKEELYAMTGSHKLIRPKKETAE